MQEVKPNFLQETTQTRHDRVKLRVYSSLETRMIFFDRLDVCSEFEWVFQHFQVASNRHPPASRPLGSSRISVRSCPISRPRWRGCGCGPEFFCLFVRIRFLAGSLLPVEHFHRTVSCQTPQNPVRSSTWSFLTWIFRDLYICLLVLKRHQH